MLVAVLNTCTKEELEEMSDEEEELTSTTLVSPTESVGALTFLDSWGDIGCNDICRG